MFRNPLILVGLGAAAAVAAVLVWVFLLRAPQSDTAANAAGSTSVSDASAGTADPLTIGADEKVLGSPDAPITVIEYASLTCSHCARFHATVLPEIKRWYIDTGKVRWVYRDFPLDVVAMAASAVAHCLPDDKYFAFLDTLFANQTNWAFRDNPREGLIEISRRAGLTREQVDTCLADEGEIQRLNAVRNVAIERFRIDGTPSFVVNGRTLGGERSFREFDELFKSLLP